MSLEYGKTEMFVLIRKKVYFEKSFVYDSVDQNTKISTPAKPQAVYDSVDQNKKISTPAKPQASPDSAD